MPCYPYSRWLLLLLGLLSGFHHSAAQAKDTFINPPPSEGSNLYYENNVFSLGDIINLAWTTDYEFITIVLWQVEFNSAPFLAQNVSAIQSYTWLVDIDGLGFLPLDASKGTNGM